MSKLRPWVGRAGVLALAVGLAPLTAACGGSAGAAGTTASNVSVGLQFARCVRAHGVPAYPDPGSDGQEPPNAKQIARSSSRFIAASQACAYVLPSGNDQTQAPTVLGQADAAAFAVCMRHHGEPNWPDATTDASGELVFNAGTVGINSHSARVLAIAHSCQSSLHLTQLPHLSN